MVTNRKRSPAATTEAMLRAAAEARVEVVTAERDAAVASLAALRAIIQQECGYLTTEQQRALRTADALLVETEGSGER